MDFETAHRLTEILLAFALLQHGIEHLRGLKDERYLFIIRSFLCALLLLGIFTAWVCVTLSVLSLLILHRFNGPYNGGSDRMGLLILWCVTLVHFMPTVFLKETVLGYLAIQLLLSYFMAGWVKIVNGDWRKGRALGHVFSFSAYSASDHLRGLANYPRLLFIASWAVIMFELSFPLALLTQTTLIIGLCIAAIFHFVNGCLFGFNRFFWVWLAAYPSLIWFQDRIFGM
jgi:hypothetical protein